MGTRRRAMVLGSALALVLMTSCTEITLLSAPETVALGDIASFVLSLAAEIGGGSGLEIYVVAEIPQDWVLVSNSYSGTVGGVPVSGSGSIVPEPFEGCLPGPRDGYQKLWIADGPFSAGGADSAQVTLDFQVNGVPQGEFQARFWLVTSDAQDSCGNPPAVATINRESHLYEYVGGTPDPRSDNYDVTSSGDGRHIYLAAGGHLVVYERTPSSGELVVRQLFNDPSVPRLEAIEISPDGDHLYGVGYSQLAVFSRDAVEGTVTLDQILVDDVGGVNGMSSAREVAVTHDGDAVYVAGQDDNAVAAFARDPATGMLTFIEAEFDEVGGVTGLSSPTALAVSPDDLSVYLVGQQSHTVAVFDRSPGSAELTFRGHLHPGSTVLYFPSDIVVSSDGSHVYATGAFSDSIAIFARTPGTGDLTLAGVAEDSVDGAVGLIEPVSLDPSPDDTLLAVAGGNSVAIFERNTASGLLTFREANFEGNGSITDLGPPHGLAFSSDGLDLYHGGSAAVAVFSNRGGVFIDGFESGDTSAWSATVP